MGPMIAYDGPDYCRLTHRVFSGFSNPVFRRAEGDGVPVLVIDFGDREAVIPLDALMGEFDIGHDTEDGRMITLIKQSLDFVAGLRPGDPLPAEVLSGAASWEPDEAHRKLANAKLQWGLVAWLNSGTGATDRPMDPEFLLRAVEDPEQRQLVQQAFAKAAEELGLPDREAVVALVEDMAKELAYVEALRSRLLRRINGMVTKLDRIVKGFRGDGSRRETLTRVHYLATTAQSQIGRRFDELDAQTGEVMSALRNAQGQQAFIRTNRDWLYVTQRAWEPLLQEWDVGGLSVNDTMLMLLDRSYRFLAPRFMPVTEWSVQLRPGRNEITEQMKW
jgi:hypothetical protein